MNFTNWLSIQRGRWRWRNAPIVVYTAITGGYDALVPPTVVNPALTYLAFIEDPTTPVPPPWQPRLINPADAGAVRNPRILSRYYKLQPHRVLPEFPLSIWVDANLHIRTDFRWLIDHYLYRYPLTFLRHPLRTCSYDEADVVKQGQLDHADRVDAQMAHYAAMGFPRGMGLFAGGFQLRQHQQPLMIEAFDLWWEEVRQHTQRDQLSGPYIFWRVGLRYQLLDGTSSANPWLDNQPHPRQKTYV